MTKEFLSVLATAISIVAFLPYIRSLKGGKTKPHVLSWVIWGLTTVVVSLAQFSDSGGPGAGSVLISGMITFYIASLAYSRKTDITITMSDKLFFFAAVGSIPLWVLTSDPLWAVCILTAIDVLGFIPTFRKAYHHPFEEHVPFFVLLAAHYLVACAALRHYSLTTVLFPIAVALSSSLLAVMITYRRKRVAQNCISAVNN